MALPEKSGEALLKLKEFGMAKTYLEQMGLEPVSKLTKAICLERARYLRDRLERGRMPKALRAQASYYARWYAWAAKHWSERARAAKAA